MCQKIGCYTCSCASLVYKFLHTLHTLPQMYTQFEKQIYDIVGSSWRLKNTDQVIAISRIMLQAERLEQRVMLLHVLQVHVLLDVHACSWGYEHSVHA